MAEPTSNRSYLGVSIAWSYVFAILLMVFIFTILVPDADGPSPWDREAFESGVLELAANFRILDELAELSIVKIADVGDGWLDVDLDLIAVSDRNFGSIALYLALAAMSVALLLRGIRQRMLAIHFHGRAEAGQLSSYFFGRGLNLFFPFGPGEMATAHALAERGVAPGTAETIVFHNRLFELLAILLVLGLGIAYLGWAGALLPMCVALVLVAAVVSLTRPLGGDERTGRRWNPLLHLWTAFNGRGVVEAIRALSATPRLLASLTVLSLATLGIEVLAYWWIKQAFSSPIDAYVLMKDLPFIHFAIVMAVANTTRILPFTFAGIGIYEIVSVSMFRAFGEGFLSGTTVTLLDSALVNGSTLAAFLIVMAVGRWPSVIETWRTFVAQSRAVAEGRA